MINAYSKPIAAVLNRYKGTDKYNEPSTTDTVSLRCRVDYKAHNVLTAEGKVVTAMCNVRIPIGQINAVIRSGHSSRAAKTIAYEDTLTFDNDTYTIVSITKQTDFSVRYIEVFVR